MTTRYFPNLQRVALLGRPNVGKSTLFNRLIGKRRAVVAPIAGTTRDRLLERISYAGRDFVLVDMAGIEPALADRNPISEGMQRQVEQALREATLVVWVVDQDLGVTAQDAKVAEILRRLNLPVVVAVNKCDDAKHEINQYEFASFGFEPVIPVSAIHARGVISLLEAIVAQLAELPVPEVVTEEIYDDGADRELRLAIVGRPNVGKSTLLNALAGEERAVVSPVSGTTRDSVDTVLTANAFFGKTYSRFQTVRIIDTAGIRQRGKMGHEVEAWSVLRSLDTRDEAQVVLLVIDAVEQLTHQDLIVAQKIFDSGRPLVLVANKWDQYLEKRKLFAGTPEEAEAQDVFLAGVLRKAPFLAWTQLMFISAHTKLNLQYLGSVVQRAYIAWSKVPDEVLLKELAEALKSHPRLKALRSIVCTHAQPPVFVVNIHGKKMPHFTTRRFIENALRETLEIGPTPIKIWIEPNVN